MSVYTVTAERTAKWWVLQAKEAPGAISQVARLDQADQIREAIAFVTGEPEDTIEIRVEPVLPRSLSERLLAAQVARTEADAAAVHAQSELRTAALELQNYHLTMRDIGRVMGVSHQRAQQLLTGDGGVRAGRTIRAPKRIDA